jgi:hypothetical protein
MHFWRWSLTDASSASSANLRAAASFSDGYGE